LKPTSIVFLAYQDAFTSTSKFQAEADRWIISRRGAMRASVAHLEVERFAIKSDI